MRRRGAEQLVDEAVLAAPQIERARAARPTSGPPNRHRPEWAEVKMTGANGRSGASRRNGVVSSASGRDAGPSIDGIKYATGPKCHYTDCEPCVPRSSSWRCASKPSCIDGGFRRKAAMATHYYTVTWDQLHRDARALAWRLMGLGPFQRHCRDQPRRPDPGRDHRPRTRPAAGRKRLRRHLPG